MQSPLIRRLLQRRTIWQITPVQQEGYSLPLVLVVVLALVGSAAALAARTSSFGFGAAFQKQSWDARSIAQFGLSTLVSRLNKEQNRGLLAVAMRPNDEDINYRTTLWSTDAAQLKDRHGNPCAEGSAEEDPDIGDIYPGRNKVGWWYVNAAGQVSPNNTNAVGRFRLIDEDTSERQGRFSMGSKQELELAPQPSGKTTAVLSVEAESIAVTNGEVRVSSRTVLEAELDIAPKCCKVTFGSMDPDASDVPRHGNNDYTRVYSETNPFGASQCNQISLNPNAFGLVWGADGDGGVFSSSGTPIVCIPDINNLCQEDDYINPLACTSPDPESCVSGNYNDLTDADEKVEQIDTLLPPAPEFYPSILTPPTPPYNALLACGMRDPITNRRETCPTLTAAQAATTTLFKFQDAAGKTYINGKASELPDYCKFTGVTRDASNNIITSNIHCVVNQIVLPSSSSMQFITGYREADGNYMPRPIRLYFPQSSASLGMRDTPLIRQSGSSGIEHCVEYTPDTSGAGLSRCRGDGLPVKITQLSMFGCNPPRENSSLLPYYGVACDTQLLTANGTPSTFGYFSYFPKGRLETAGTTSFSGVFWVNDLQANGTVDFKVPASGVAEVFELLGINPGENSNCSGSIYGECRPYEPRWDFVARSIRRFSFRFG